MKLLRLIVLLILASTAAWLWASVTTAPPQGGISGLACTALTCTFTPPTLATTGTTLTFATSDGQVSGILPLRALTAGAATPVILISVASGASVGGSLEYNVTTTDAAPNYQVRHGSIHFSGTNKAGTETCTVSAATEAADGSTFTTSTGGADTLTYGITCDTSPANGFYISFNGVSSLVENSFNIKPRYNLDCSISGACSASAAP